MPYIIIIDKTGTIKETNVKEYNASELYKKANFKSAEGFRLEHKWIIGTNQQVAIYGKKNGKAGQENKYDFPPPIDSVLFFGGCVLTKLGNDSTIQDLRITDWNIIYDKLMGGFDDLDGNEDDDAEEEEDDDDIPPGMKLSKDGYVCDDFIVEDDDEIDYDNLSVEEEEDDDEEEDDEEVIVKNDKNKRVKPIKIVKTAKIQKQKQIIKTNEPENVFLDYQSELSEEEYL